MAAIGGAATKKVTDLLAASSGLEYTIGAIEEREVVKLPAVSAAQVVAQNVAFELAERSAGVRYPAVYVYCTKIVNTLKEKFRTFSGRLEMVVEVRVSHDRLEGLAREVQFYAEAVTQVLDYNRGDWGGGMFYTGGYEVEFGPMKHGGKNFIQAAKVMFEVQASAG